MKLSRLDCGHRCNLSGTKCGSGYEISGKLVNSLYKLSVYSNPHVFRMDLEGKGSERTRLHRAEDPPVYGFDTLRTGEKRREEDGVV